MTAVKMEGRGRRARMTSVLARTSALAFVAPFVAIGLLVLGGAAAEEYVTFGNLNNTLGTSHIVVTHRACHLACPAASTTIATWTRSDEARQELPHTRQPHTCLCGVPWNGDPSARGNHVCRALAVDPATIRRDGLYGLLEIDGFEISHRRALSSAAVDTAMSTRPSEQCEEGAPADAGHAAGDSTCGSEAVAAQHYVNGDQHQINDGENSTEASEARGDDSDGDGDEEEMVWWLDPAFNPVVPSHALKVHISDLKQTLRVLKAQKRDAVALFYRRKCPHSIMFAPVFASLQPFLPNAVFLWVDVSDVWNLALWKHYRLRLTPSLSVFPQSTHFQTFPLTSSEIGASLHHVARTLNATAFDTRIFPEYVCPEDDVYEQYKGTVFVAMMDALSIFQLHLPPTPRDISYLAQVTESILQSGLVNALQDGDVFAAERYIGHLNFVHIWAASVSSDVSLFTPAAAKSYPVIAGLGVLVLGCISISMSSYIVAKVTDNV